MLEPTLTPDLEEGIAGLSLDDVDVDSVPERKPHFLDYDAVPPPDYEDGFGASSGEQLKMDKKYERDGEVSDYELAASGYTKKEFTQDDNTLHFTQSGAGLGSGAVGKKSTAKHFLDENPIPPDYMLAQELREMREHRSLDRNFERQSAQQQQLDELPPRNGGGSPASAGRPSRSKEPSYTLSRFLDGDSPAPAPRLPKGAAWTTSFDERYTSSAVEATLGSKVECVYSLLSMLGSNDPLEMAKKFLELSGNAQSCATLRRSGCMPLLVQMMHAPDNDQEVRKCAGQALHNVVHSHPDEKSGRREAKVLRLLDQIVDYCSFLKTLLQSGGEAIADDSDRHPLAAISSLMKVSFDEEHRHAMCELGALHAIPNLVHLDHAVHGPKPEDQCCNSLRRYALMALTNLTFGDENNKALLCGQKQFMEALVAQLDSAPDDLLQVTASVLRNLSWRADSNMKAVLNEIGTVTALALAAMRNRSENTLKAILSALWNLSAHCSTNKAEFCAVDGALAFLVGMLSYEGPSKTLKIIENAGGILRNVSSHIAVCEPYRQILRQHNCLAILLQQLKSESLTVVSNSCGTLWNLSARSPEDQKFLWDNGAVPMLRSLIHSKHAMISEGSSSALKNLLNFRPAVQNHNQLDPIARSMGLKALPTLEARKAKALQQELGERHTAETCDNLDTGGKLSKERASSSSRRHPPVPRLTRSAMLTKSESRDSVYSAKSDCAYDHLIRSASASDAHRKVKPKMADFDMEMEQDTEATEEQPIDYSVKYSENATKTSTYQETDLDQPTDFSLRYAENQIESDLDISGSAGPQKSTITAPAETVPVKSEGQEILLILDDSVKCYQTEDTPYVISNAASVTDLRVSAKTEADVKPEAREVASKEEAPKKLPKLSQCGSGSYTPEKPINYCEEGTPGYFSRYDSLSSLDESGKANQATVGTDAEIKPKSEKLEDQESQPAEQVLVKPTTQANSALETPLMFSRRSSMDSLVHDPDVDVANCDDKSSVVSDFSRLASGVISPSEIPDSPTQSMPQSPRRNSMAGLTQNVDSPLPAIPASLQPLRSVFEDDLSSFNVEHTPAQFSTATSLSNLSIVDDEKAPASVAEEDNEDELLLANCINMGMQRKPTEVVKTTVVNTELDVAEETIRSYCTEDTPALLSKVASNTNLSAISMSSNEPKEGTSGQAQIYTHQLSDDVSSNASDCGGAAGNLLQQCIRDGMKKPQNEVTSDPIAMLRRGGNQLPGYLPSADEMNKFLVEDSPCNFSVVSGLSNLTVGSSLVGPAVQLKETVSSTVDSKTGTDIKPARQEQDRRPPHWQDDSLSSLSIDSEDDTNLLSQAIAAGCNRPKSNLGFSSNGKRSSSLSSSQPIAINAATSASSLNSAMTVRKNQPQESYSSVDSSDSNDNQSKSLFELCILKGMYKSKEPGARAQQLQEQPIVGSSSAQSNPNLKQFDSLPVQLSSGGQPKRQRHHHHHHHHRERERERKDEKLLQECINTGISKKINTVPKNVLATSAAALEPCHPMAATISASAHSTAAPDVEQKAHATSNPHQQLSPHPNSLVLPNPTDVIATVTDTARSQAALDQESEIGNQNGLEIGTGSKDLDQEDRSSDESNQSFIMETVVRLDSALNETCISGASEKHKDPDLMLKSVERLTMEFVTSAEQLRSSSNNHSSSNSHNQSCSNSHKNNSSNNTWNEHTCPNDVSFPSVSQTAPVLASLSLDEDATEARSLHEFVEITPTNEQQPASLEGETDTLINGQADSHSGSSGGLNFQLGGQVQNAGVRLEPQRLLFNGTSASMMTNSTMIAFEARALAENLLQPAASDEDNTEMTFSMNSLDLDNVRPPSGMESLNSCYQEHSQPSSLRQQLPSKSPRFARKIFPANLVARRALGHLAGSAESVNSSCNLLDNIKPPSLMDELLDSMISVDSIQSEVADGDQDCSMATTISVSNYETAACDDQTMTVLQSCFDEDEDATMNDYSSAESTPKQGSTPSPNRRSLTPKQKRRLIKDRYKTYTIATSCELEALEANETLQIEIVETDVPVATPSPRANGRRRGSAERYKTQLIECPRALIQPQSDDCPSEQLSSIRAMMQQFTYITNINIGQSQETSENADSTGEAEESPECDQNSETESCDGQEPAQLPPPPPMVELKSPTVKPATLEPATAVKLVRGRKKPAYVSPYSMQSQRSNNNTASAKKKTLSPTIAKRSVVPAGAGARLPAKKKPTPPPEPAPARLERQGTFVKDEPTNSNVQVPVVETKPAQTSPGHRASKLPTKKTTTGDSPSKAGSPKRVPLAPVRRMTPQRANTSLRLAGAKSPAATRVVSARVSSTTPPSRSNSNLNGSSAAAAAAAKINQAQSRIANIWKRVDEAKTKKSSSNLKSQKTKSSNTLNGNGTKPTLLRSSTFDNTPNPAPAGGGVKSKLPVVGARK
ncbi:LOW QUALITY PROTEIN: adenomatous polyposis coli homolog [Drosophila eugracilis]|uniref:LOW QUALITY PROTEIN: adenomatous polyposis coli homolog n=1 Tax=Drosophila eugracilis TaxID=29029 RepID=UPI001BDB0504|nr:LOW QUALITY PROTEIN: adenomatous polyposis coli homolog [Drosophila eugracilis]